MQSKAATVDEYLASLPADRRAALQAVRKVIHANLGKGFKEGMQYGMIGYCVPHSVYPRGYHCDPKQPLPFASLASQKNHMSFSLMSVYLDSAEERWFKAAWQKTGKKLDMGKACVRFQAPRGRAARGGGSGVRPHLGAELHRALRSRARDVEASAREEGGREEARRRCKEGGRRVEALEEGREVSLLDRGVLERERSLCPGARAG
jgi:hypothetical protein